MELMRKLAESLSPDARRLLLRDGVALEEENERTRQFVRTFRLPNPLRVMHANAYRTIRVGDEPSRLLSDERAIVDALHFTFSGEYECNGQRFDRWIGPDGAIFIECSPNRRFLSMNFEDAHRISMWPDLAEGTEQRFPTTDFLVSSADLLDDYGRMLEAVAGYMTRSTRPLYRYESPDLDLECVDFYQRHQVAIEYVKLALSQRFWGAVGSKMPLGEGIMTEEEAREFVANFTVTARMTDHDVIQTCLSCQEKIYISFSDVGAPARCPACAKQIGTAAGIVFVYDSSAFERLLAEVPITIVACYWSPASWASVIGAGQLHDATLKSDQQFLSLLIDASQLDALAARQEVSEVPTYIRYANGTESGRLTGPVSPSGLLDFAMR